MNVGHNCGLFGVESSPDASRLAYAGLYALQHRGQESAGIVASDGSVFHGYKSLGLVVDCFDEGVLSGIRGNLAIGHNRYSTMGSSSSVNIQPLVVDLKGSPLAIAHNGNLVNASELRARMESDG